MKKQDTVNTFNEGLIMDLNPLVTPNNVLVNCLNGTITTFSGNENVLQNDMGNGRVETAFLPEGYVPLGTAELGGIIYIVSYNPLVDKCQIGCFPSPERNITSDEVTDQKNEKQFSIREFFSEENLIKSPYKRLILLDKVLHPGDKFQIYCEQLKNNQNYISAKQIGNSNPDLFPRYLKFNVVAIQDNGQINNLNKTLVWNDQSNYYILDNKIEMENGKLNLDEYRNLVSSNYNVFNSKVDGKLAILAELECIDSFEVSWDAVKDDDNNWNFYFFLNWTYDNNTSSNKINLYGITVKADKVPDLFERELTDYPSNQPSNRTTDILQNEDTIFYTPKWINTISENPNYAENDGITIPRKNDGTDNQYLLYNPFKISSEIKGVVNFDVYPRMPFGKLDYLKQSFSIDLDKLGNGDIDLKEYRYWYNQEGITINWALEAYPERNKQITEVKFNFYKFDANVKNWIEQNAEHIDSSRVICDYWEDGSEVNQIGSKPIQYIVPPKNSYSGHFTETIDSLDDNQLYLTELCINYNNEKEIKYYRFLYTSDVFNSYYFKENDFKKIVLQEAINQNIIYNTDQVTYLNESSVSNLLDEHGNIISVIPSNHNEVTQSNYTVNSTYSCDINSNIIATINNPTFTLEVKGVNNLLTSSNTEINSKQQLLEVGGNMTEVDTLTEIEKTSSIHNAQITGNNFKGKFQQQLITPFQVKYEKEDITEVQYELVPLDILDSWLLIGGRRKAINIHLSDTNDGQSANIIDEFGDDSHNLGGLAIYTNVYNEIKSRLSGTDILALRYKVRSDISGEGGSQGVYTGWGQGTWSASNDEPAKATNQIYYNSNNSNLAVLIIYAMLDSNDQVQLFTYSHSSGTWYGTSVAQYETYGKPGTAYKWPYRYKPFGILANLATPELLKKPFEKYFKLSSTLRQLITKSWSAIRYYQDYIWESKNTIQGKAILNIKVNQVDLKLENDKVRNLSYNPEQSFSVDCLIKGIEKFEPYVNQLLYSNANVTKVFYNNSGIDTYIPIENISTKSLYDINGKQIKFLKQDLGEINKELDDLVDSKQQLSCIDGYARIKMQSVNTKDKLMAMARQEEQSITVSNIINITSND